MFYHAHIHTQESTYHIHTHTNKHVLVWRNIITNAGSLFLLEKNALIPSRRNTTRTLSFFHPPPPAPFMLLDVRTKHDWVGDLRFPSGLKPSQTVRIFFYSFSNEFAENKWSTWNSPNFHSVTTHGINQHLYFLFLKNRRRGDSYLLIKLWSFLISAFLNGIIFKIK